MSDVVAIPVRVRVDPIVFTADGVMSFDDVRHRKSKPDAFTVRIRSIEASVTVTRESLEQAQSNVELVRMMSEDMAKGFASLIADAMADEYQRAHTIPNPPPLTDVSTLNGIGA